MDIYDIAKASGYSTATVSRVINKQNNVSKKAREKIERSSRRTDILQIELQGLLPKKQRAYWNTVPDIRKYFESQSAYELERKLESSGFSTLLCVTTDDLAKEEIIP